MIYIYIDGKIKRVPNHQPVRYPATKKNICWFVNIPLIPKD